MNNNLFYVLLPALLFYPVYTLAVLFKVRDFIQNSGTTDEEVIYRRLHWLVPVLQHWMMGSAFHTFISIFVLVVYLVGKPFNTVVVASVMLINLMVHLWLTVRKLKEVDRDSRNVRSRKFDVSSSKGSGPGLSPEEQERLRQAWGQGDYTPDVELPPKR